MNDTLVIVGHEYFTGFIIGWRDFPHMQQLCNIASVCVCVCVCACVLSFRVF